MAEVETSRDGAVLTITLNRPEKLNAFDGAMHERLTAVLKEARSPDARAVVLTGAGRGFCVGQDLSELRDEDRDVAGLLRERWNRHVLALRALEKPVLAAVNGAAAGAGLSLACACDIRLAADSAVFVPAFSGRRLSAAEALEWGLVAQVVETDRVRSRAQELAAELAALPTRGIAMTKRLFEGAFTARLEDQLELEAQLQAAATQTEDFAEGVAAFLEKREPRFSGR
jgi:2-(1,2-epoxy-1,2-dihydrophenyl)acetyl-CoA isomerase